MAGDGLLGLGARAPRRAGVFEPLPEEARGEAVEVERFGTQRIDALTAMVVGEADHAQRARRIEGIRYEADLARRRFFEVDPANRLVAAALEADWNERLRVLEEACREREARAAARESELSERQVERIRELTRDFEQVWNAPETGNTDRKRLLGHLIEDATLTRDGYEVTIELRMRGGRSLVLDRIVHNAYRIELTGESLRKRNKPPPLDASDPEPTKR